MRDVLSHNFTHRVAESVLSPDHYHHSCYIYLSYMLLTVLVLGRFSYKAGYNFATDAFFKAQLYASECWTVNKADVLRIDALDQWCLRRILGFKWSDFVRNEDVCHATQQPPISSVVKTRRLSLFGHIARMNESTDASRILFEPPPEVWRKPRGRPRNSWVRTVTNDLANSYTGLPEARETAQYRVYWRMFTKHSATHS